MIPPVVVASAASVLLYLLPTFVAASISRDRSPIRRLHEVGAALALDALLVLVVARFIPLGDAARWTRLPWLAALVFLRWRAPWRPDASLIGIGLASAAMVAVGFRRISYGLALWDRDWHIPLVSALRAQRAPFENVFLPATPLRYHYLGDVAAAMIQSLSGDRVSASLALSITHDLYLALLAFTVAATCFLTARELAPRSPHVPLAAAVGLAGAWATLFASPFVLTHAPLDTLLHTTNSGELCGHSYLPFASIAYRPHVVVAAFHLVLVFLSMATLAQGASRRADAPRRVVPLLASATALALSDEASHALIGASLVATSVLVPGAIHRRWLVGVAIALTFVALLPVVSAGFDASLAIGGAASKVELVSWRHVKLFDPPVELADRAAFERVLRRDYLPQLACAGLTALCALWSRTRASIAVAVFYVTLVALSLFAALRVEVNRAPDEGHRFITASMVLAPVVAAWTFAALRGALHPRGVALAVIVASGASGWLWKDSFIRHRFEVQATPSERRWTGRYNANEVDCLEWTGAPRRGQPPTEYLDADIAYIFAGCQPVRLLGGASKWNLAVHGIRTGWHALRSFEAIGDEVAPTAIVCESRPAIPWRSMPCQWALDHLQCRPFGRFTRCALPSSERASFYRHLL